MKLQQVTNEDGRMCAQLLNLLKSGRWDLSGADAEAFVATRKWVQALAGELATNLKSAASSSGPAKAKSPTPAPVAAPVAPAAASKKPASRSKKK